MKSKKYSIIWLWRRSSNHPKVVCCFRQVCVSNCRFAVDGEESGIVKMRMMGKCGKWWLSTIGCCLGVGMCWSSSTLKRLPLESFGNIIPKSPLKQLHAQPCQGANPSAGSRYKLCSFLHRPVLFQASPWRNALGIWATCQIVHFVLMSHITAPVKKIRNSPKTVSIWPVVCYSNMLKC